MRHTWPWMAVLIVVGLGLGVAIAGTPANGNSFELGAADVGTSATSPDDTTTPTVSAPTTAGSDSTSAATTTPAIDPATTASPTETVAGTTVAETPTSSVAPATSVEPTTTIDAGPLDRADVRLVVANGDGRFNLAGANGTRLEQAGYVDIDLTDVGDRVPATILYYRPGFDDEARIVAADLLVPNAVLEPLPSTPVTINDQFGDVIIVLGPDAVR